MSHIQGALSYLPVRRQALLPLLSVLLLTQCAASALAAQIAKHSPAGVPRLEELAGDWMDASTLRTLPSVANFSGNVKVSPNILGTALLTLPPYSKAYGGDTLNLILNGHPLDAERVRWYPYQVLRQATAGSLAVESTLRMVFEDQGVLLRLVLHNRGTQPLPVKLELVASAFFRRFDKGWNDWTIPRPSAAEAYDIRAAQGGKVCISRDTKSAACIACAFSQPPDALNTVGNRGRAVWSMTIAPGGTETLEMAMAVGADPDSTAQQAQSWVGDFGSRFDQAQALWEKRWEQAFTPDNGHFSGNAPVLATDDQKVRRDYYMSALTELIEERTNLPMAPRSYVTGGPEWALTIQYFWDTSLTSSLFARLDPAMFKAQLEGFLTLDYHHCYARCMQSGKPAGPWYSANDLSLFTMFWDYVSITGDWSILQDKVAGRTVLQHMDGIVTYWKSLVAPNAVLADYGRADNLLECAPTYINQVPSLNAANVWMMRRMAEVHDHLGDTARASQYRADAAKLEKEVLKLYIPGEGVWNCRHSDGKTVQLRHCYDYITVGESLTDDLTPTMKREMTAFVERELLVPGWIRAQSLSDPSASVSDRPDHGPRGSYDGWPALTVATLCDFGRYAKAVDLLRQFEGVTHEGSFTQSHELIPSGHGRFQIRIAHRGGQDYPAMCGASFASESIIRGLFGCELRVGEGPLTIAKSSLPRGFRGTLSEIRYRGALYTVESTAHGMIVSKESD